MKKILTLLTLAISTAFATNVNVQKDNVTSQLSGPVVAGNGVAISATGTGTNTATAAPWSGVTGTPTTLTGYGVTNTLTTTSPLTGGGSLASNLTVGIPVATSSVNGYLSSANWTTFNSKQAAGNYITALTGDVTATGPGSVSATVTRLNGVSLAGLATGILKNTTATGVPSIAIAADFPTLNQSTTGNAATATALATGRTIAITGDLAYTSPAFTGSGNITAAGTLATVNSNVGTFGGATQSAAVTVNAKGLVTAASNTPIAIPASAISDGTATGRALLTGATQTAGTIYAGPGTGAAAPPTWRALIQSDIQSADAPLRNALAPRGGLAFAGTAGARVYAVPGSAGALGADAFSVVVTHEVPATTQATLRSVFVLGDNATTPSQTGSFYCRYTALDLSVSFFNSLGNYVVATFTNFISSYGGKTVIFGVVRNASGNPTFYLNGSVIVPTFDAPVGTGNWQASVATNYLLVGSDDASRSFIGKIYSATLYNLALTAADALEIYELGGGVPERFKNPAAGINQWASQVGLPLNLAIASWTGSVVGNVITASTASTGFIAGVIISNPNWKFGRYRIKYSLTLNSGQAPALGDGNTFQTPRLTAGTNQSLEFVNTVSGQLLFVNVLAAGDFVLTVTNLTYIGAVAHYDADLDGIGYQLHDQSTNKLDALLTTTGVSWTKSSRRNAVTFSTSTNGNQQILGQQALPANARITSWVINAAGSATVSLGNISGGAQFLSAGSISTGLNDITPATRFDSTNNLWVNSNSTNALVHTISYDLAN
jgi:hypothetical protein